MSFVKIILILLTYFVVGCGTLTKPEESRTSFAYSFKMESGCDGNIAWKKFTSLPPLNAKVVEIAGNETAGKRHAHKLCGEYVNNVMIKAGAKLNWELGPHREPESEEYIYGQSVKTLEAHTTLNAAGVLPGDILGYKGGLVRQWNGRTRPGYEDYSFDRSPKTANSHVAIVAAVAKDGSALCVFEGGFKDGNGARASTYDLSITTITRGRVKIFRPIARQNPRAPRTIFRYPGEVDYWRCGKVDPYGQCLKFQPSVCLEVDSRGICTKAEPGHELAVGN